MPHEKRCQQAAPLTIRRRKPVTRAIDEVAELGPLLGREQKPAVDERISRAVLDPFVDVDVERVEDFVLHEILDAFAARVQLALQNLAERLVIHAAVVESRPRRVDERHAQRGVELVAIRIKIGEIGIKPARVGKQLLDRDRAPAVVAPFRQCVTRLLVERTAGLPAARRWRRRRRNSSSRYRSCAASRRRNRPRNLQRANGRPAPRERPSRRASPSNAQRWRNGPR